MIPDYLQFRMLRIDRTTSYKEANLINKIDRHILSYKFRIRYELGKLNGTSKTFWTHPNCIFEHTSQKQLSLCRRGFGIE